MPFPAANESQGVARWIYEKLIAASGVTALIGQRAYESLAPQDTALPCVVFSLSHGVAVQATGGCGRLLVEEDWLVKGIAESGGYVSADAISVQVDGALNAQSGSVVIGSVTYTIQGVFKDDPVRYMEVHAGKRIFHSGGVYRILVRAD